MKVYQESHAGWTPKSNMIGGYEILDANGWALATLAYDYRFTSNATNHFRANLFAAAPDLLAALTGTLVANHFTLASQDEPEWAKRARAAIAKARGEAE